jgi:hypothetical protein
VPRNRKRKLEHSTLSMEELRANQQALFDRSKQRMRDTIEAEARSRMHAQSALPSSGTHTDDGTLPPAALR